MINKLKKNIKNNISNIITITGLLIVNYSLFMYTHTSNYIYLLMMCIGFTFDYFDGYVARKLDIKSEIGNILDKLVDKINQFVLLIVLQIKFNIKSKFMLLYLFREIIMLYLRKKNIKSKYSSIFGKIKTAIFPLSILLFHYKSKYKLIFLNILSIYNLVTLML